MQSSTTQIELEFLFSAKDASRIKFMKMSKVKSADSVVHQFLRVLSKPSQAPKCHWSNCDCPKNPKETRKLRPECWWECHKTSDPTSSQVIHQTVFHQIFSHKKQMTQIKASEDPKNGGQKKKKKKLRRKKKKSDCRLKRRGNDWLLGLMFLSRHIVPAVQSQFISQTYW